MKALELLIQTPENEEGLPEINDIQQAYRRLKDLETKAYTIHDYIGKTGIEGVFEEDLRGFFGKKIFYTDSKGHFLHELPGSSPPFRSAHPFNHIK